MHFKILTEDKNALGGIATRKEVSVYLTKSDKHYFTVLIYIPIQAFRSSSSILRIKLQR